MNNILTLETTKYELKLENFTGPLDLLCYLVDKNKMEISEVKISEITDQYVNYLKTMENLNLDVTSEFLVMASTLIYIKSKSLLPKTIEDESELTEEELLRRIIEYKKFKEISTSLKMRFEEFSKRYYRMPDKIVLPKQKIEKEYTYNLIFENYKDLLEKNQMKKNIKIADMQKIAILETVSVASKVKDIFRELIKKRKFIFNKLCLTNKYNKLETVTAFTGLLELSRRKKIISSQEKLFGDILVEKNKKIV